MNERPAAGGALGVTTGTEAASSIPPAIHNENEPRCALCPFAAATAMPGHRNAAPYPHDTPDAVATPRTRRGIVDQRSRWGNPYPVAEHGRARAIACTAGISTARPVCSTSTPRAGRPRPRLLVPLDQACHADVLLAAVNGGGGHG